MTTQTTPALTVMAGSIVETAMSTLSAALLTVKPYTTWLVTQLYLSSKDNWKPLYEEDDLGEMREVRIRGL